MDMPFAVPFIHRLRVTEDVCGADVAVLAELLESGDSGPAKVLLVAETALESSAVRLADCLRADGSVDLVGQPLVVPGGEEVKNTSAVVEQLLAEINQSNLDRRSYIVAIGGGAMLDAIGYAAAIAHRGVRLIRLPSTTLAQADSGVGVKNAINQFGKKNWVGTFAVPWGVINDATLLRSLSDRDFYSGFSEAVKVSLLKDEADFEWLCQSATQIRHRDPIVTGEAIALSCQWHLRHITQGGDPFEMLEARPLDFGHWSAHRLEPLSQYDIRHGEAVGIGVLIDCIYSSLKFGLDPSVVEQVRDCLENLGLPLWHDCLQPLDRLMVGLEEFRQHLGGRLTITMLRGVGDPIDVHEIDEAAMRKAIGQLKP
ncbi:MAG: 3-dehydroquinate synthase [Rubripirellula sp.]|nr:3-dehydroquinate synthase [Rubripirellula sp.]